MLANNKQVAALVGLFKSGTKLTYNKGEYIIRPGETPAHVYYIEFGFVKAFNISKYGEENLLIIRKSHEIFPLIWTITGDEVDVIYQSIGQTVIWRVSSENFISSLGTKTSAILPLLDMVTEMYRIHSQRILNLEYRSVRERVVSFLLTMSERFGEATDEGIMINVPLRHQDIASSINASRETASRELAILERKGLINNKRSYITLIDLEKLKSFL